jgi:hypothetical protein
MFKSQSTLPFIPFLALFLLLGVSCQTANPSGEECCALVPVKIASAGVDTSGNLTVNIEDSSGGFGQYVFTREALLNSSGARGSFNRPDDLMMIPPYLLGISDARMWYSDSDIEGSITVPVR